MTLLPRTLLVLLLALMVAEPAYSQEWLKRYLKGRREKESEAKASPAPAATPESISAVQPTVVIVGGTASTESTALAPEPEIRRALPVDGTEKTMPPEPPPLTFDSDIPVRRAEPVNRALAVPAPETQTAGKVTDATAAVSPTPLPIRRAERVTPAVTPAPVANPSPTPGPQTVAVAPAPVSPTPSPTPAPVQAVAPSPSPSASPVVVPTATPIVAATPAPSASPSPTPAETSPNLDPGVSVITLSPAAASLPPDVVQINYANTFYAKKAFDRAAPEYERYLSLYPLGTERQAATFRLAESYRQIGNLNAARRNYEMVALNYRDGDFIGAAAYRLADLCFQEQDYPAALMFFQKAAAKITDPALALSAKFHAGCCLEKLRSTTDALSAYEEVLAVKENNPFRDASHLGVARLFADSGQKSQAIEHLQTLAAETPADSVKAEALVRIALLWGELKQNEKAYAAFNHALKMPTLGEWKEPAVIGLLRLAYDDGNYPQVLSVYGAHLTEFGAARPEALLIAANSNRQLKKFPAAQALYEEVIRDFPDSSYAKDAQYERLIVSYNTNAPDLIRDVDAYLAANPDATSKRDQLLLMKAEYLFYKAKDYAAAAPLYASLETSGLPSASRAEALYKVGWCYVSAQPPDTVRAIEAFGKFLRTNPAHKNAPTALAQRALCYQRAKKYPEALRDFNDLLNRYPDRANPERELALKQKALILGQQQENQAMAETFQRLLKEYPKSKSAGLAYYWIGRTAFENKQYKESIPPLAAARKLDPEYAGKASALILQANFYIEDKEAVATEVDNAEKPGGSIPTKAPAGILRWLGMEFLKAGDARRAEKYLGLLTARASASSDEVKADDWLNLGRARVKLSKWSEAQSTLHTYLQQTSEPVPQATGYLDLGEAQLGAIDLDGAQKSADQVLQLQPEGRLNAKGRMLSGAVALARLNFEEAAKLFLSVAVVYDDPVITPQALEKGYLAYKKAGNEPQAAKVLNELQSRYPEYPVPVAK